jgi:DNA/RNA-binding protein KIN17
MGGDGGALTAKAIGKRIKAKGLGRLRWYCQMCEKQCRDENGFKCHTNTPAHQHQLALFAEKPEIFVERFSNIFLKDFLSLLHQRYGSNAVSANNVYQEYIKDRNHVHMNSTRWTTLTEFVKDLGLLGKCRVDDRDGTWWVTYVDRDAVERKQRADAMERSRLNEEERAEQRLERMMQADEHLCSDATVPPDLTSNSKDEMDLVAIDISLQNKNSNRLRRGLQNQMQSMGAFKDLESTKIMSTNMQGNTQQNQHREGSSRSVLDEIIAEHKRSNEIHRQHPLSHVGPSSLGIGSPPVTDSLTPSRGSEQDPIRSPMTDKSVPCESWLRSGIIVKVVSEGLAGGPYYRKKGIVVSLMDRYTGHIRLLDSGALLQVDQDDLETVIPKPGGAVMFVKGIHAGKLGIILDIDEASYALSVRLQSSAIVINDVEYDEISKITADYVNKD